MSQCPVPEGSRIMLVEMPNDPCPIKFGSFGTVTGGTKDQIWVKWDSGRSLNLIVDVDRYEVVDSAKHHPGHDLEQGRDGPDSVWQASRNAHVDEDGRIHFVGDSCGTHYEAVIAETTLNEAGMQITVGKKFTICCGQDFMAGTICSLKAGHRGPHAPICPFCGVDWFSDPGACECEYEVDDAPDPS